MSSQPSTPFIPPLLSANHSPNPQPSPVIPGPGGNTGNSYPTYFQTGGGYPAYSPHSSAVPFIPPSPNAGASPFIPPTPGLPGGANPAAAAAAAPPPRGHSRGAPSHDFGAYPPGGPSPHMQQPPPLVPSMSYYGPGMGPYTPYGPMGPPVFSPYLPPHSAPPHFGMQTPFTTGGVPLASPFGPQSGGLPPPTWGHPNPYNTPIPPPGAQLGGGWGPNPHFAPPMQRGASGPQDQWFPGGNQGRRGPEPPPQVHDRMDKFTPGPHYYPVLDPFLAKVVQARIIINPLIAIPEDSSNQPHLNWNMLFPTSNVHRSDTPKHLSWSNGREAPATFPRISSMRLVSESYPWMIEVRAKDKDYGVTCGEVIEAIGYDMGKMSHQQDFNNLTPRERNDLSAAYRLNRSREDGAPGGALGEGLKRLDFMRRNTIFGGVEVNERVVAGKCGDVLPCVFVLHCLRNFPMTKQDIKDNEMRARSAAAQAGGGSRTPAPGARSRANSNSRPGIRVESPTTTSDDDDDADYDR